MNNEEIKGLGDDIARITKLTRLDRLASKIAKVFGKEDCGCDQRREIMNEMFPYRKTNKIVDSTEKKDEEKE